MRTATCSFGAVFTEQHNGLFCRDIVSTLHTIEYQVFPKSDKRILFRVADRDHQIVVPVSLQTRVLHLCQNVKPAGVFASEYVIAKIIAHAVDNYQFLLWCVKCCSFGFDEGRWEQIRHLQQSHIVRYHCLLNLLLPAVFILSQTHVK